jgi:hypothetical protein
MPLWAEYSAPMKSENGFGLSAPRRQTNGDEWCESGAEPGKSRRCIAHEMRHGAQKWCARRDRLTRDGMKRFSQGFIATCQKKGLTTLGRRR